MPILEYAVVFAIVGLAVAYLTRSLWRSGSGNCGGCHGACGSDEPRERA